jgi:predicted permease
MPDLRYAFRSLWQSGGFTFVVVASLALGIGANTALFSLVNRVLIQPLPVNEPGQLAHVQRVLELAGDKVKSIRLAAADIESLARNSAVLSDATGFLNLDRPAVIVNGGLEPPLAVQKVLPGFFDTLGLRMAIGTPHNNSRSAVISHRYWRDRFGGNAGVLGSSLNIDGQIYPIAGVAPERFYGIELETSPSAWVWSDGVSGPPFEMVGRLRPQVGFADAEIAMSSSFRELSGREIEGLSVGARVDPAGRGISIVRAEYGRPLTALLILAALALLATCANVGVLFAVRNASRARELAIRVSLGARQSRLVAQLLIEGALIAAGGAVLALPIARAVVATILSMLPVAGEALEFRIDLPLLSFLIVISLICTLLFAAAPAWQATRPGLLAQGLQTSHAATLSRPAHRLLRTLVAAQASLSVIVLIGAGLFLQTLRNLAQTEPGFDSDHLIQVLVDPKGSGYQLNQVGSLYRRLTERLVAIPGVKSVSGVRNTILRGPLSGWSDVEQVEVGPAFFETMRIPLVKGRYLAGIDHTLAGFDAVPIPDDRSIYLPNRVVISETLANRLFGSADPIGQRLPGPLRQQPVIVGVVKDARFSTLRADPRPPIYVSQGPEPNRFNGILIRTSVNPSTLVRAFQREVRREHPRLLLGVHTMHEEMDRSIARERIAAAISALFGTLGLVLVCVGVFGVAAYTVALRTNELGIRIALGASNWDVISESLRSTLLSFMAGTAVGTMFAIAGTRLVAGTIAGLLYGLTPADSLNIFMAVCVLVAAVIAASVIPAYRATIVDPNSAIRSGFKSGLSRV